MCALDDISSRQRVASWVRWRGSWKAVQQSAEGRMGGEEMERASAGNSALMFGYERQEGAERAGAGGHLAYWGSVCLCVF